LEGGDKNHCKDRAQATRVCKTLQDAEFPFPTSTPLADENVLHEGDFDQHSWSEGAEKFFLIAC